MKCFHCSKKINYLINCPLCSKNLCSQLCLEYHNQSIHNNLNNNKRENINTNQTLRGDMNYINYKRSPVFSPFITEGVFEEKIKFDEKYNLNNFNIETKNGKSIEIGTGSYGNIFLCRNKIDGKLYARKYMNKDYLKIKLKSLSPIYNEIYFQSRIIHQNIVRLLYVKETDDNFDLIMEYANKGNLYNYLIKKTHLDEKESFNFFSQIANAVYFLHKHDLIHRDIKPENILLFENNLCKLCDFGWCTKLNGGLRNTFCGTPEYISPEIIDKMGYGKEVDVWSLGILLYEMIHGISPFRPKDNALNLRKVLESIKTHNLKFKSDVSEECKDLICHLLDEHVERRYKIEDIFNSKFFKKYENRNLVLPLDNYGSDSKEQNNKNIYKNNPKSLSSKKRSFNRENYSFKTPVKGNNFIKKIYNGIKTTNINNIKQPGNYGFYTPQIFPNFKKKEHIITAKVTKLSPVNNNKIIKCISPNSSVKHNRSKTGFKRAEVTPINNYIFNISLQKMPKNIYNNPLDYGNFENYDYKKPKMHSLSKATVKKLNPYEYTDMNNSINRNSYKNNIKPIINNYQTNLMSIITDDSPKDNLKEKNNILFNNNTNKRCSQVIKLNSTSSPKGNDLLNRYNYPSLKHHYFKSNLSAIKEMDDFIRLKRSPSLELMQVKKNLNNEFKPLNNYNTFTNTNSDFYRPKIRKIIPKMPNTISRVKSFNYIRKKINGARAKPFNKPEILSFYNNRFKNLKIDKKEEISLNGDDNITKINTYTTTNQNSSSKLNTLEQNIKKTNTNNLINMIDPGYKVAYNKNDNFTDATNTIREEINNNNNNIKVIPKKEPRKKNKKIMKLIEEHNRKQMMEKNLKKNKKDENKEENIRNEIVDDNRSETKINNNMVPKLFSVKTFNVNESEALEELKKTPRKNGDKTKIAPNELLNRFSLKLKTFSNELFN